MKNAKRARDNNVKLLWKKKTSGAEKRLEADGIFNQETEAEEKKLNASVQAAKEKADAKSANNPNKAEAANAESVVSKSAENAAEAADIAKAADDKAEAEKAENAEKSEATEKTEAAEAISAPAESEEKPEVEKTASAENAEKTEASVPEAERKAEAEKAKPKADAKKQKDTDTEKHGGRMIKLVNWAVMIVLIMAACFGVYTEFDKVMLDNDTYSESFYVVQSDKISERVRTVLITDLHLKEYGKDNSELLASLKELEPDFITVVGDMFLYGSNTYEPMYELLESMVDIAPVYFALGNHEISEYLNGHREILTRISGTGAVLLNNSTVDVTVKGNLLSIGGLSEHADGIKRYAPDFMEDFTAHKGFKLLLTHYPINFMGYVEYADADLALAGHEHGGIIRLPFAGALISADQGLLPDLTEGMTYPGSYPLIISRGMGDSSSVPRINNQPELVIVDITPNKLEFSY
ncbi:MAG: metallophosphoesterase [Eubacteriales bacterium]|nr:metallophosphoesterase [Eubacteriales bacterium]